ncbi:MAG: class I SAM-dependent rRNA methyltransferase [Parachlamydiaceae bacterium]|nr:class I SAM-dependent rRNA methyltransferase [Parachlamydiaceae bacterium]
MDTSVILKPGKEKPLLHRHHWIFSGAVDRFPSFTDGDLLPVCSHDGRHLGSGYFNRKSGIVGRMLSFDSTLPLEALENSLAKALEYRKDLFVNSETNVYRLINGEGDGLPGLIIDRYNDLLVLQVSTLGIDKLKPFIVKWLLKHLQPKSIYERSHLPSRKEEGLKEFSGFLYGKEIPIVEVQENGIRYTIDLIKGQKTGFFCDHREMRKMIGQMSKGKRVLNCFAYSGGFTLAAMAGGAKHVDTVEISASALEQAKENVQLNGYPLIPESFFQSDVFEFLRDKPLDYDIVILDPPAFAKRQKDIIAACRGYKEINRVAMQKMPPGSWLLTCSCSYHVDEALFQKVLFQSAVEAGRKVRIVQKHILAADHPINLCHPESDYLKSFLLYLE